MRTTRIKSLRANIGSPGKILEGQTYVNQNYKNKVSATNSGSPGKILEGQAYIVNQNYTIKVSAYLPW
jgi:hypothetical protein